MTCRPQASVATYRRGTPVSVNSSTSKRQQQAAQVAQATLAVRSGAGLAGGLAAWVNDRPVGGDTGVVSVSARDDRAGRQRSLPHRGD